ncbi:hypothetical protein CYY_002314 [Polysphondylium violaceum]|uniref:Uncharacterized protein n=1 Tax=Polysphondylium violaceum TaxID=133409 RepID=A0A8J4Q0C8_9MYCE|nr:hypothetical protein CYY_002314 [Polysphondylium violaceum]
MIICISNCQSPLLKKGVYTIRQSFTDPTVCNKTGGTAFHINEEPSWQLGGYSSWVFKEDSGRLIVLSNDKFVISGELAPTFDQKACHTFYVNMMFEPSKIRGRIVKDLFPKTYNKTVDTNKWSFYQPTVDSSVWYGTGCNHVYWIKYNFPESPMVSVGIGANGRNLNLGMYGYFPWSNVIEMNIDIIDPLKK